MKKVILIVEDDQKNLKLVRDILQVSGFSTIEATNGELGVELARVKEPDLILMDIQLPILDGIKATKILKDADSTEKIPIIALSAFAMDKDKEEMIRAGCEAFLTKPIDIRELIKTVGEFLSR